MKAYYFSKKDKRLQHGDGRHIRTGRAHKVKEPIALCERGLHASIRPIDALRYAPGPYLWEVELSGKILRSADKCCATERTYLRGFNAEGLLREFARKQAKINIHKIKPYCSKHNFELILHWLETGDESLRSAARSAARSATKPREGAAAESAENAAAWSAEAAARPAVEDAAKIASRAAILSAVWPATCSAAEATARLAANDMLQQMIDERFATQQA